MALSYIGKIINLTSAHDVRYRGVLAGIDPVQHTIQLSNVYSMGTEDRRPPGEYIPPVPDPYRFIIFRASEVKDLAVDTSAPPPVPSDPAIVGADMGPPGQQQFYQANQGFAPPPAPMQQQQQVAPPAPAPAPTQRTQSNGAAGGGRRANGSVQTATASLESVERALGDLRTGGGRRGGGGGGGARAAPAEPLRVPNADFDFAASNARFEKPADGDSGGAGEEVAYDPGRSFFDNLTPARGGPGGGERGRGGRGRGGRSRRDEERDKNVATFGEPGGVGLMGPGQYVGGWGGYGRRGGRGRRPGGGGGGGGGGSGGRGQQSGT